MTQYLTIDELDDLTARRKVRPAMNAFGDWSAYDSDGNPLVSVLGASETDVIRTAHSSLGGYEFVATNEGTDKELQPFGKYGTQTEQRFEERGDEPTYDPAAQVWYSGTKGERIERVYVANEIERSYNPLHGYHKEADGIVSCYHCGTTFSARWFVMQSTGGTLDRSAMERFTVEAMQHTVACRSEYAGAVMARMVTWAGKPILRSTASMFR